MKRKAIAALLLVGAVSAGAFLVGSQSATATVRSVEVVETECDDSSYESSIQQRPADGGTRVVIEDVFVGPSPDHTLEASLAETSGNYTLMFSPQAATTASDTADCTGELHYRAVVFVPTERFDLEIVHGDETHIVLRNDESSSSAEAESSASDSVTTTDSATTDSATTDSATTDSSA